MKSLTEHLNRLINKTSLLNITINEDGSIIIDNLVDNEYLNESVTKYEDYSRRPINDIKSLNLLIKNIKDKLSMYQSATVQGSTYLENIKFNNKGANWKFRISNHRGFLRDGDEGDNKAIRSFVTKDVYPNNKGKRFRDSQEFIVPSINWVFKYQGKDMTIEEVIYKISKFKK